MTLFRLHRFFREPRKLLWVGVFILLAGCAQAIQETQTLVPVSATTRPLAQEAPTASPQPTINIPENVPLVDTTQHIVPLEEIYFDTFQPQNRAVPLSNASADLILRLRDAIPPIHHPVYENADQALAG